MFFVLFLDGKFRKNGFRRKIVVGFINSSQKVITTHALKMKESYPEAIRALIEDTYMDDTILVGPDEKEIEKIVGILSKNFKVEDQGDLSDYLGVNIERRKDGKIEMTQPTLTLSILKDVGLWENGKKNQATSRTTPAYSTTILTSDEGGEDFKDKDFNYRQVIGKLLYLEKSTRPDIACAVHQCARYCNAPKVSHAQAVKRICRYLLGTRDKGLIFDPKEDSFDCWDMVLRVILNPYYLIAYFGKPLLVLQNNWGGVST